MDYFTLGGCCCFSLRTGTIFFGVVETIGSLLMAARFINLSTFPDFVENEDGTINHELSQNVRFAAIFFSIVFLIHAIFAILVLVGVKQKNPKYVLAYVYQYFVIWGLIIIMAFGSLIVDLSSEEPTNGGVIFISIIILFVIFVVTAFIISVVNGYAKELKTPANNASTTAGAEEMQATAGIYQAADP